MTTPPEAPDNRDDARLTAVAAMAADWSVSTYVTGGNGAAACAHIEPVPHPTSTTTPLLGQAIRRGSQEKHGTSAIAARACSRVRASRLAVSP